MKIPTSAFASFPGLLVLAILAVAAAGCGGSDDNACVKTAKTLCAAACTCGGSSGCAIGDSEGSLSFPSEANCVALFSLGCPDGEGVDFAACQSALGTPTCVQSSSGRVLDPPAACEPADQ